MLIISDWTLINISIFLLHDDYYSLMLVCKSIYKYLNYIKENTRPYLEICEKLLKKECIIYGGYVRDHFTNNLISNDIDCIISSYISNKFLEHLINDITHTDFTFLEKIIELKSSRLIMKKILNFISKNDNNRFCLKNIVKYIISSELNLDILSINNTSYINFDWDIMFTINVFYNGHIIKLDVKFTYEKLNKDFICNSIYQKIYINESSLIFFNNPIKSYVIESYNNYKVIYFTLDDFNIYDAINDCKNKKAHSINIIKEYDPVDTIHLIQNNSIYRSTNINLCCKKIHLNIDHHFLLRIQKMIDKGFKISNSTIDINKNNIHNIVHYQSCILHQDI